MNSVHVTQLLDRQTILNFTEMFPPQVGPHPTCVSVYSVCKFRNVVQGQTGSVAQKKQSATKC